MALRRTLTKDAWTAKRLEVWEHMLYLLHGAVRQAHVNPGFRVLMVPGASDMFRGLCFTQAPKREILSSESVEATIHEPLDFVSGEYRGSHLNHPVVDKEEYVIFGTPKRVDYPMCMGVKITCHHRTLAYILNPEACAFV